MRDDLAEKILEKSVKKESGCWEWQAHKQHWGRQYPYGMVWDSQKKKMIMAHRASYEAFVGDITGCVLHKCDNPCCVNPDHLFLGTRADNMRDMIEKKRDRKCFGTNHHRAIVDENIVREIRKSKKPLSYFMGKYGLAKTSVHSIRSGKNWSHVK